MNIPNREYSSQPRTKSWATLLIWGSLALLVVVTVVMVVEQATTMNDGMRPVIGTMGLSLPLFLLLWVPMMAVMMLLSVAPLASLVGRMLATGPQAVVEVNQLVIGYLGAWVLAGLPAYLVLLGFDTMIKQAPGATRWVDAALLAVAGAYQWMPFKRMCLRHCRSPLAFLMQVMGMKGSLRGVLSGLLLGFDACPSRPRHEECGADGDIRRHHLCGEDLAIRHGVCPCCWRSTDLARRSHPGSSRDRLRPLFLHRHVESNPSWHSSHACCRPLSNLEL